MVGRRGGRPPAVTPGVTSSEHVVLVRRRSQGA